MSARYAQSKTLPAWVLLAALAGLVLGLGAVFAGLLGVLLAAGALAFAIVAAQRLPLEWLLARQGAQPLPVSRAPQLHRTLRQLARRAQLPAVPRLFVTPSVQPTAFTAGHERPIIVVSAGLLQSLSVPEVAGVLAHELAHIHNQDLRILQWASAFNTVLRGLARAAQFALVISLFMMLFGQAPMPLIGLALMMLGPWLGRLLQLSLSRSREYQADATAVQLTGDPRALASALMRLEAMQSGLLGRLFGLHNAMVPHWLRTHPPTSERVRRLVQPLGATNVPAAAYPRRVVPRLWLTRSYTPLHPRFSD